jgi:hypothetical protein
MIFLWNSTVDNKTNMKIEYSYVQVKTNYIMRNKRTVLIPNIQRETNFSSWYTIMIIIIIGTKR